MLGWLIEIRNFFLALTLAWVGVSLSNADKVEVEKADQIKPTIEATASANCSSIRRH